MDRHLKWWLLLGGTAGMLAFAAAAVWHQWEQRRHLDLVCFQFELDAWQLDRAASSAREAAAIATELNHSSYAIRRMYAELKTADTLEQRAKAHRQRAASLRQRLEGLAWLTIREDEIPAVDTTEAERMRQTKVLVHIPGAGAP